MEQPPQTYRLTWQGIEIEARYWPRKWGVTAHLEIESVRPEHAPLPITDTGYRSHFHPPGTVESLGGDVVAQVVAWLDEAAALPAWCERVEATRQGDLSHEAGAGLIAQGVAACQYAYPPMLSQSSWGAD